jgi:hypothetical protein
MAKKRARSSSKKTATLELPSSSNHVRNPRKEGYDGRRLNRVVERLREQATRLASLAKQMQDADLERVEVDGHAMLVRGLNQIDNFADNASRAIREASEANRAI